MSKSKAVKTTSLLWLGSLIGAGCAFLTQVILARSLGPQAFALGFTVMCILASLVVSCSAKSLPLNAKKSIVFA